MTETAIISAILKEVETAEAKYSWENTNLIKQALVLLEEAGEVAQAVNNLDEKNGTIEQVRTELIQTAAMCFRMLKGLDKTDNEDVNVPEESRLVLCAQFGCYEVATTDFMQMQHYVCSTCARKLSHLFIDKFINRMK